jgi:hypothetical protein
LTFSPSRVNTEVMPSAAVARAATIISSKVSPGMNLDTARRMNGTRVPFSRSH